MSSQDYDDPTSDQAITRRYAEEQRDQDHYIGTISKHEMVVDRWDWEELNNRIESSKAFLERLVKICKTNESMGWDLKNVKITRIEFTSIRWLIEEEITK